MDVDQNIISKARFPFFPFLMIFFLLGLTATYLVIGILKNQKTEEGVISDVNISVTPPISYPFVTGPPTRSLTGEISSLSGTVEILKRESKDWVEASKSSYIVTGEGIKTGILSKALISFNNFFNFEIDEDSVVYLINSIPEKLMLELERGDITASNSSPLSIRVYDSIFYASGSANFDIGINSRGLVVIKINEGNGTFSYIGSDNETKVVNLIKKSVLTYNKDTLTTSVR